MKGFRNRSRQPKRFDVENLRNSRSEESAHHEGTGGYIRRFLPGFNPIDGKLMDRLVELQLLVY
jgi:hypothetical protein